jgi:S-adenosylmethionine hydrolase
MAKPLIAFVSDFGTRDHYAGVMKGVVLTINPEVTIVDVSHDLPAHDIPFAAHELAATYRYFPAGTIFLVVVDPGVGSSRRGLAVEAGDWRFVAPDNGVLTAVLQEAPAKKVVELTERRYARPTVSRTFEGRDRFAPAAAWLSKGVHLTALGRAVTDYVLLDLPKPQLENGVLHGVVIRVDHFGNVVTNLDRRACEKLAEGGGGLHSPWAARRSAASSRPTPRSARTKSGRSSAARTSSSAPRTPRALRIGSGSPWARPSSSAGRRRGAGALR